MIPTRLLLSVLPQHVAVEMKGDIMSPVEVCKILKQRHSISNNVVSSHFDVSGNKKML